MITMESLNNRDQFTLEDKILWDMALTYTSNIYYMQESDERKKDILVNSLSQMISIFKSTNPPDQVDILCEKMFDRIINDSDNLEVELSDIADMYYEYRKQRQGDY